MTTFEVMQSALDRAKATAQAIAILNKYPELLGREPDLAKFVRLLAKP